jgi:hypothetical protein
MVHVPEFADSELPALSMAKYLMVVVEATCIGAVYTGDVIIGGEPSTVKWMVAAVFTSSDTVTMPEYVPGSGLALVTGAVVLMLIDDATGA